MIPPHDDLPILCAWTKLGTEQDRTCDAKNCRNPAIFLTEIYERYDMFKEAVDQGEEDEGRLIDLVWNETVAEQLGETYAIHYHLASCLFCQIQQLCSFLDTTNIAALTNLLSGMRIHSYTVVQYHWYSQPSKGLIAVTSFTTPEMVIRTIVHEGEGA